VAVTAGVDPVANRLIIGAELAPVIGGAALRPRPDGQGVTAQLADIIRTPAGLPAGPQVALVGFTCSSPEVVTFHLRERPEATDVTSLRRRCGHNPPSLATRDFLINSIAF
jgi:hypothetical protein